MDHTNHLSANNGAISKRTFTLKIATFVRESVSYNNAAFYWDRELVFTKSVNWCSLLNASQLNWAICV